MSATSRSTDSSGSMPTMVRHEYAHFTDHLRRHRTLRDRLVKVADELPQAVTAGAFRDQEISR